MSAEFSRLRRDNCAMFSGNACDPLLSLTVVGPALLSRRRFPTIHVATRRLCAPTALRESVRPPVRSPCRRSVSPAGVLSLLSMADESSTISHAGVEKSRALADGEAMRELMHRVKGGMNNVAISLQLLESNLAKESASSADSTWVLSMALRGLTQAVRSLRLVAVRTGIEVQPVGDSIAPSIDDIVAMLGAIARRHHVQFESEVDGDQRMSRMDIDHVSEILTAAVGAIQQAGRSARVSLRYADKPRPRYMLEILPQSGAPATTDFFVRRRSRARR